MRLEIMLVSSALMAIGCSGPRAKPPAATAYGTQIVEASGGKQIAEVGSRLPEPVVVKVNGADGNAVTGAFVRFYGEGVRFSPAEALSDASGQVATTVDLGFSAGDYQITAETPKQGGGTSSVSVRGIALGYEATLGQAINAQYCIRCHDPESSAERVSNFDNLSPAPHQFTDGATYNRFQDADLTNWIAHGGQAAGKSPQMPAYGATLKPAEIRALIAYIRSIADPPYQTSGVKYGK